MTDDGKLRVRVPLHTQFEASQVKALDCVIAVNGNASDPQALLHACVTDVPVELKLQRDLESYMSYIYRERSSLRSCNFVFA